eukprot:TRINITY_DN8581_c0_g1_i1.p1 TRINITY_DN8581_c0_g1~~TRINITY_DN8581_c0_g1_i1.p1  ORF type:complete len:532 (-),score=60.83 TRINITY_DN8581_c0_g1_i1:112-1707(-)
MCIRDRRRVHGDIVMKASNTTNQHKTNQILGRYVVKDRLGSGSFGKIYKAVDTQTNEVVAIKIDRFRSSNNSAVQTTLAKEAQILAELAEETGFAKLMLNARENEIEMLFMTCLGHNLEKLFKICGGKFSMKTVLIIADQILNRIEALHSKGWLHRDIKPENFTIGLTKNWNLIHLIDFGLAKQYRDSSGKHIAYREGRGMVGTARYTSVHSHKGGEHSRRDDLESIGYLLIYFLKGKLPWQNLPFDNNAEKYRKIAEMKNNIPPETLCKDLPDAFLKYMIYVKNLTFTQAPDYKFLKKLFRILFFEQRFEYDYNYDWIKKEENTSIYDKSSVQNLNGTLPLYPRDKDVGLQDNRPPNTQKPYEESANIAENEVDEENVHINKVRDSRPKKSMAELKIETFVSRSKQSLSASNISRRDRSAARPSATLLHPPDSILTRAVNQYLQPPISGLSHSGANINIDERSDTISKRINYGSFLLPSDNNPRTPINGLPLDEEKATLDFVLYDNRQSSHRIGTPPKGRSLTPNRDPMG